jgi:hypothetical protein
MPLFTYVVSYRDNSHVAQGSHSNFNGFAMTWAASIPASALRALTPVLRKELARRAYEGAFENVSGMTHVWKKSIDIGGARLTVHAVQTER